MKLSIVRVLFEVGVLPSVMKGAYSITFYYFEHSIYASIARVSVAVANNEGSNLVTCDELFWYNLAQI